MHTRCPIVPPDIAVLGGGISGLATAFWLTRLIPNATVTLYEKQDRLGGVIGTSMVRDRMIETGPLAFPSGAPATAELMEGCGLGALCAAARQTGGLGLWIGSRIIPFSRTPVSILKSGVLSPLGLLRLLIEPFIPRGSSRDESVGSFFRRRTGGEFMDALMEPMSSGILAGDPWKMSMAANFPMLFAMEKRWGSMARGFWKKRSDQASKTASNAASKTASENAHNTAHKGAAPPVMAAGIDGNQSIVDAIAAELSRKGVRIRLSSSVIAIRATATRRPALVFEGSPEPLPYDGIISCIPPRETSRLYGEAKPEVKRFLEGIPYASVALGYLSYRKRDLEGGFGGVGCLVQGRTGIGILSLFMPSRMFPHRCPEDEELVRIMAGGAKSKSAGELGESGLRHLSSDAAVRILAPKETPIDFIAIRHQEILPQLVIGHIESLAKVTALLEAEVPGLILAGTGYVGAGIENAVKDGKRAAGEFLMRMATVV